MDLLVMKIKVVRKRLAAANKLVRMSQKEATNGEDRSERSIMMWVSVRNTHKRSKDNKPIKGGGGAPTGAHMRR